MQAAWATFKDSKDEEVIKALEAWDPKKEEEKVEQVGFLISVIVFVVVWDPKKEEENVGAVGLLIGVIVCVRRPNGAHEKNSVAPTALWGAA